MRQWKFEVRGDNHRGERVAIVTDSREAAEKAADELRREAHLGVKIIEN